MQYIIEGIPILLALYVLVVCSRKYLYDRRKHNRAILTMGVFSALLLIIAQTSWYVNSIIMHNDICTWLSQHTWYLFNLVTMLAFIKLASGGTYNVEKPTSARN
jgi:hypothetical protein